jgi:Resolvase, N terminal domain/Recombinase
MSMFHQDDDALAEALQRIAAGDASLLTVERLRDVGESLREVVGVIEWLQAAGADLVAEDVQLDTRTDDGAHAVAILAEIASWEHQPSARRPRRGRPGLDRHAPELTQRIAAMREQGMTLQTIADALNADGVPTPRGGAQWRPSSVQSALGYRRPRPPAPGLPPRPPHPPDHPPPPEGPRPRHRRQPPPPPPARPKP